VPRACGNAIDHAKPKQDATGFLMTVLPWCRGKTNFFEKRVGDYQKSGVMAGLNNTNQHTIAFDEDF